MRHCNLCFGAVFCSSRALGFVRKSDECRWHVLYFVAFCLASRLPLLKRNECDWRCLYFAPLSNKILIRHIPYQPEHS